MASAFSTEVPPNFITTTELAFAFADFIFECFTCKNPRAYFPAVGRYGLKENAAKAGELRGEPEKTYYQIICGTRLLPKIPQASAQLEISIPAIEISARVFSSLKTNTTNTIDTPLVA